MRDRTIQLKPVGVVRTILSNDEVRESWHEGIDAEIEIFEEYAPALDRIEGFSHLVVLFYLHETTRAQREDPPGQAEEVSPVRVETGGSATGGRVLSGLTPPAKPAGSDHRQAAIEAGKRLDGRTGSMPSTTHRSWTSSPTLLRGA